MADNIAGRHRVPGRFNPLSELKVIAKESAQPAVKGAAIVAASGGLVATFSSPAQAADNAAAAGTQTASVVGPQLGSVASTSALSSIGYAKPAAKQATPAPRVIEDIVAKHAAEAKAKAAAERRAAAERASRASERVALDAPAPASGIVGIAQSMFGVPYRYGGTTPSGFDCSGFSSWVYRQAGINIPRTASAQQSAATPVSNPQPGDLVFFGYPAYHVGIYVSPGRMIDAQRSGTTIGYHSIWTTPAGYGRF